MVCYAASGWEQTVEQTLVLGGINKRVRLPPSEWPSEMGDMVSYSCTGSLVHLLELSWAF